MLYTDKKIQYTYQNVIYLFNLKWYFGSKSSKSFHKPCVVTVNCDVTISRNTVSRFTLPCYPSDHHNQQRIHRRRLPVPPEKSCANHHQQLATRNSQEAQYC